MEVSHLKRLYGVEENEEIGGEVYVENTMVLCDEKGYSKCRRLYDRQGRNIHSDEARGTGTNGLVAFKIREAS